MNASTPLATRLKARPKFDRALLDRVLRRLPNEFARRALDSSEAVHKLLGTLDCEDSEETRATQNMCLIALTKLKLIRVLNGKKPGANFAKYQKTSVPLVRKHRISITAKRLEARAFLKVGRDAYAEALRLKGDLRQTKLGEAAGAYDCAAGRFSIAGEYGELLNQAGVDYMKALEANEEAAKLYKLLGYGPLAEECGEKAVRAAKLAKKKFDAYLAGSGVQTTPRVGEPVAGELSSEANEQIVKEALALVRVS